jgi:hypothetical protein
VRYGSLCLYKRNPLSFDEVFVGFQCLAPLVIYVWGPKLFCDVVTCLACIRS